MTAQSKADAQDLRRAISGGLLASVCATLGWLAWLFGTAVLHDPKAVFGPLVGAVLGVALHAWEHYHEVAHYEANVGNWHEEEADEEPRPRRFAAGLARSLVPLVLLFVALTCEHVLGKLMEEYLVPFLASLATLFPVGVVFSVVFNREGEELGLGFLFFRGLATGIGSGLLACGVEALMGVEIQWGGLLGWWSLVGVGLSFAAGSRPLNAGKAVWGTVLTIILTVVVCLPVTNRLVAKIPFPYLRLPVQMVGLAAAASLDAPGMPAQYWNAAANAEEVAAVKAEKAKAEAAKRAAEAAATAQMSPAERFRAIGEAEKRLSEPPDAVQEDLARDRETQLAREWAKGWNSDLVRSWIIVLLFAVGLGLSPLAEESLRPIDYPNSRTARNDRIFAALLIGGVLVACLLVRIAPSIFGHSHEAAEPHAIRPGPRPSA